MLAACAFVAACGGAAPPGPVVIDVAPPPPSSSVATVVTPPPPPEEEFFSPDPPLDGLQVREAWSFRQETWSGAGEHQQHCRELGYPARLRAVVLREANEALVARGLPPGLPETVRQAALVAAFTDFKPTVVTPAEPLVKLIVCTEGVAPRSGRDRFVDALRARGLVPDLPFGEPTVAWRRVHQDRREEVGFSWSLVKEEDVAAVLTKRGFVLGGDPPRWENAGEHVQARMRGTALWWNAAL